MKRGIIFDIQKFSIHDGPGIRTTVFLKGCPLNCLWCHNPESKNARPEISFIPEKCVGCGHCVAACANACHRFVDGCHVYDRAACRHCGQCAAECYARSLEVIGREMAIEEVMAEVLKDVPFYETSGGGMTVSGGEPMAQFRFTRQLLRQAKVKGLHNCLETSGFAPSRQYEELLPLVDLFLYDCKETDPNRHLEFTGVPLEPIASNLLRLDAAGAKIILRCPIIPGLNARDDHLRAIAELANKLANLQEVHILPYHPLGKSKSVRIGVEYLVKCADFPDNNQVEHWLELVAKNCRHPVRRN